ncbi:TPA: transposase [Pseudomonas aeruginosa]|nr:transposase [Pseudomonas aeruginosa]HBO3680272.1 transposase [Pseudomonas aeruginosa]HCR1215064.1 transposase [Pseudomonas aeruginosa]
MSTQRFTPEFKAEAVRQVIGRGYLVAEIAARLGVSTHSLYKWVKAVPPDKSEKQACEPVGSQERNPAAAGPGASP